MPNCRLWKRAIPLRRGAYLKKAISADPTNGEATQLLGLSYYRGGHPADAIPLLEKIQGWYPRANADASYVLGVCYIQTKDYPQARKAFGKMFEVPPDSAASYLFTAQMLLRQEFDPVAEEYAQKAAALDPKLPLAHYLLGELYIYKSRIPEAIAEFQKELAINPAHAATYYKLADAYSRIQKYEDAQHSLQRSICGGDLFEAGRNHGPQQSHDPPSARPGVPRYGEERRSRERAEVGGTTANQTKSSVARWIYKAAA